MLLLQESTFAQTTSRIVEQSVSKRNGKLIYFRKETSPCVFRFCNIVIFFSLFSVNELCYSRQILAST